MRVALFPLISLLLLLPQLLSPLMATEQVFYIGTHTNKDSRGIYRCVLDLDTGALGSIDLVAEARNPSWLSWHPNESILYAVGEIGWSKGRGEGFVSSYALQKDGSLQGLIEQSSGAPGPCHCSVHPDGKTLLVANYKGGAVASLPLAPDGQLLEARSVIAHAGETGPHPKRQQAPHAHSITCDPSGRFVLACDLGLDRVFIYRLDNGRLTSHADITIAPGGGPRHLAFHPGGEQVYVNHELDGKLSVFRWQADIGALTHQQTLPTLPDDFDAEAITNTTAETRVSDDGRFVYVSNRGHDSLAVFSVQGDGGLSFVTRVATGAHPRHYNIDPSGRWLIVANRDDDTLVSYAVDQTSGIPTATTHTASVSMPTCIRFVGEKR